MFVKNTLLSAQFKLWLNNRGINILFTLKKFAFNLSSLVNLLAFVVYVHYKID